jgi:putative ABC transport system ATP-binding protein
MQNDSVTETSYIPRNPTVDNVNPPMGQSATQPIIEIRDVTKTYKRGRQQVDVLRGVSLRINKGEFVAITGASGSGKSTLLQLIGGLDKPTSGDVVIDQININKLGDGKLSMFRNKTIGFVFQFFYLQPFLKLAKNIELPAMFAHRKRKERRDEVQSLLTQVSLTERADHYPKELSGGQMQRAAIARALLNNPKILLADEPTGNLDSNNSKEIVDLFHQIRDERGTTVIIVTHNPEIAAGADREIKLTDGAIV